MLDNNFIQGMLLEERMVLLVARSLFGSNGEVRLDTALSNADIDWRTIRNYLNYHDLSSLAYSDLRKYSLISETEIKPLESAYYSCLFYNNLLWHEFMMITTILNENNIVFTPLKGIAFIAERLYEERSFSRPMCDIDLLIKNEDLGFVETTMNDLGYSKNTHGLKEDYWKKHHYQLSFFKKNQKISYSVEIHWGLDYKRDIPLLPSLWKRVRRINAEGQDIYLLSPEDTIFGLALNQRSFGNTLSLKSVCDLAKLINKYASVLDWDYVIREATTGRMRTTLYFTLLQAHLLLNVKLPFSTLERLTVPKLKKMLIERFIIKNTFFSEQKVPNYESGSWLYLKQHFLLYDSYSEPVRFILDMPIEQFAKFYRFPVYSHRARMLYIFRYLYFLKSILAATFKQTFGINKVWHDGKK
jgi:hypothetical protein